MPRGDIWGRNAASIEKEKFRRKQKAKENKLDKIREKMEEDVIQSKLKN